MKMSEAIKNRYDFVLLYDVKDGNPNGDPDADNQPRVDPETEHGLITDVCLKRKVRNYIQTAYAEEEGMEIYVRDGSILNVQHERAGRDKSTEDARTWMCRNFFDIRTFGAVMSTGERNCGQVRGPIQMTFGRSIDPVIISGHTITRCAVTTEKEAAGRDKNQTMGRKYTIPYALYRTHGFISPALAAKTGFSEDDLSKFWMSLANMFDTDRSAARGLMSTCKVIVFKHDSYLGNASASSLFNRVTVAQVNSPAREFSDYIVTINSSDLPRGVTLQSLV
jgi:CRISPR-associated protein Csd2